MPSFDIQGALGAGYSPTDVANFLAANPSLTKFDVGGAMKAGYSADEVVDHLNPPPGINANPSTPNDYSGVPIALGQGYTPQQIVNRIASLTDDRGSQVRTAIQQGYTPAQIVDHLNPNATGGLGNLQNVPVLAPIMRGAAHVEGSMANLADDLGAHGIARNLRSDIDQEDLQAPTSAGSIGPNLAAGNYGAALKSLPSAALEGLGATAPTLAAGMAGGPAVAVPVAAAAGAVTQGDDLARARAVNNGRAYPSASDLALGLGGGAALGAVNAVGLPGAAQAAGSGLVSAVKNIGLHAAADAAQPQIQAAVTSADTNAGYTPASAADTASAALQGATSRTAAGITSPVADAALRAVSPTKQAAAALSKYNAMTPDQQQQVQNVVAAHGALQDATANAIGTSAATPKQAAATASWNIHNGVSGLVDKLLSDGTIDDAGRQTINQTMNAAGSPSLVLGQDHLDNLDGLGLQPNDATALKNAAVQTQLLNDPGLLRASSGPFQSLAGALSGHAAGALVGGLMGGYHGAVGGYIVGGAVRPVVRSTLDSLGSALDGSVGFGTTPLQRSADDGRAMLQAAGVTAPSATDDLQAALVRTRSAIAAQRALMPGTLPQVLQAAANRAAVAPTIAAANVPASGLATGIAQAPNPLAVAIARAAAQNPSASPVAGPGGMSGASPGTYSPDTGGLSPEAMAMAKRLPDWVFGLGSNLEDALHVSGMARPVNMASEVADALSSLQARGWLPNDIVDGLRSHSGRVVPQVYELIRNELLLRNGIDRTAGGVGNVGDGSAVSNDNAGGDAMSVAAQ